MSDSAKIKIEIFQRIELFPKQKLRQVLSFLKTLEKEEKNNQEGNIDSFAGVWKDMDEDFFEDLTTNLQHNRAQDIRTF